MPTRGHRLPLSGKQMGGGEGEGGKSERRKTSVTMIIGWWREIERVKAWCRGSPELSSGLVLYWKESQDPEKLLFTRLWFITAKGYRLRSAKDKGDPAQSFQWFPQWSPVDGTQFSRQQVMTWMKYYQPGMLTQPQRPEIPSGRPVTQAWVTPTTDRGYSVSSPLGS